MYNHIRPETGLRMKRFLLIFSASVAGLNLAVSQAHAKEIDLIPHRAVYDLSLAASNDVSDIEGLSGRWVFDFSGSICEGYKANSRLVMNFLTTEGARLIDRRVESQEAADGNTFTFRTQSLIDKEVQEEVAGQALRDDRGVTIHYDKPQQIKVELGPALFPTNQVLQILKSAEAGKHFFTSPIFDGTELIEASTDVSVVIGKAEAIAEDDHERAALGSLASDMFLPVTMAYFEPKAEPAGEHISDYDVSFKMHPGGIQRDIHIRYDDYSMKAKLVELVTSPNKIGCETKSNQSAE